MIFAPTIETIDKQKKPANLDLMQRTVIFIMGVFILLAAIFLTRGAKFVWGPTTHPMNPTPTTVTPAVALANPASVNCGKLGGTLIIKKNGSGGEYGLCDFGDNMQCEEWALYRGDCPVGGRKTTGFDNMEEKYCAWLGGTTYAVPNATCTFKDGSTCSDTALYNGTCSPGQHK